MNFKEFVKDRDEALLSLDKEKIMAYARKWGVNELLIPRQEEIFWIAIHKARTAAKSLPMEARSESKRWLQARGFHSMDDGEVPL